MSHIRNKAIEGLKAGDSFSVSRTFTEADVLQFGDLSRDYNPVHYDERFAAAKSFHARICHGLLVFGLQRLHLAVALLQLLLQSTGRWAKVLEYAALAHADHLHGRCNRDPPG